MRGFSRRQKSRMRRDDEEDSYYSGGSGSRRGAGIPPTHRRDDGHHYYDEYSYDSRDSRTWGQDPMGYRDGYDDEYYGGYSGDGSRGHSYAGWSSGDERHMREGPERKTRMTHYHHQPYRQYHPHWPPHYEEASPDYFPERSHGDFFHNPSPEYSGGYSDQPYEYGHREMYSRRQPSRKMETYSGPGLVLHRSPSSASSRSRDRSRQVDVVPKQSLSLESGEPLQSKSLSLDSSSVGETSWGSPPSLRRASSRTSHRSNRSRASNRTRLSMISESGVTVQAGNLGSRYMEDGPLSNRSSGSSKKFYGRGTILSKGSSTTFGSRETAGDRYHHSEVLYANDKAKALLDDLIDMGYEVDSRDGVLPKDSQSTMDTSERYGKIDLNTSMNSKSSNRLGLSGKWKSVVVAPQEDETIESILPVDQIEVVAKETVDSASTGSRGPSTRSSQRSNDETLSTGSRSSETKETKDTKGSSGSAADEDNTTYGYDEDVERVESAPEEDNGSNDYTDFDESTISTKETREQVMKRLAKNGIRRTQSSINSKRVAGDNEGYFSTARTPTSDGEYVPDHISAIEDASANVSDITSVMSFANSVTFPNMAGAMTDRFERAFEHLALNCRYALSKN